MAILGYWCSVPNNKCTGKVDSSVRSTWHKDKKSMTRCKEAYLKSQGYEKISNREWRCPEGGILVLCKNPSKLQRVRKGKEGRAMQEYHAIVQW